MLASREKEVAQLAVKKYLDALCVCAWALTSCLMAASTFALAAWLRRPLTPATVLVSLSLFNVLLLPLNALPWVVGGLVEAHVSASRLAAFMAQREAAGAQHTPDGARAAEAADEFSEVGSVISSPHARSALLPAPGSARSPVAGITAGVYSFGWEQVLQNPLGRRLGKGSAGALSRASGSGAPLAVQLLGATFCGHATRSADLSREAHVVLKDVSFTVPKVCTFLFVTLTASTCISAMSYIYGSLHGTCSILLCTYALPLAFITLIRKRSMRARK